MGKKVLVTGGGGFIGTSLVKLLVKSGYDCTVFDNFSRGREDRLQDVRKQIRLVNGDIRDPQHVIDATCGMDMVLHLAYVNGTEFFYSKPDLVLDVGIRGMLNVIDACRKHNVPELVLASSSEVYQTPPTIPTPEDVPLLIPDVYNPRFSYGGGKIACELLAIHMAGRFMKRVVIFRPHNVYGPNMGWEHVIPQFACRMLESPCSTGQSIPFVIQGSGRETRSFIYIEDFSRGVLLLLEKGLHLNTYHIGSGVEIEIQELAMSVAEYYQIPIQIQPGVLSKGSTHRRCPDIKKIQGLGFRADTSLKDGLAATLSWYKDHLHLKPT